MSEKKRAKRRLTVKDFAGDGEPYTEVQVKISIRILGKAITRSRLAVSVFPDPALEELARKSLRERKIEQYGLNEEGYFGACLSANFNGWEDLDDDYPRIDESGKSRYENECLKAMNQYIEKSVEWALEMNRQGMAEAGLHGESGKIM
jgi:hypothetical protein